MSLLLEQVTAQQPLILQNRQALPKKRFIVLSKIKQDLVEQIVLLAIILAAIFSW